MSKEDRDNILAARAADAMARVASVAKGKNMSEWEDESGSRISQTTDIVARLRAPEQWRSFPDPDDDAPLEAAAEIERLRSFGQRLLDGGVTEEEWIEAVNAFTGKERQHG